MKKGLIEKQNSYSIIIQTLDNHYNIWKDNLIFSNTVTLLKNKYELFNETYLKSGSHTHKSSIKKTTIRNEITELVYPVSVKVKSYAYITGNETLAKTVGIVKSRFVLARDNDFITLVRTVISKANENIDNLGPYQVTQGMIDELEAKTESFVAEIIALNERQKEATANTRQVEVVSKEIDSLLKNQLDLLMIVYAETNRDFYSLYKIQRKIHHLPTTQMAIMGRVVDAESEMPLAGVLVRIKTHRIKRKSSEKGQFWIKNVPNGKHKIEFSKDGYETQEHSIITMTGITQKPLIEMEIIEK